MKNFVCVFLFVAGLVFQGSFVAASIGAIDAAWARRGASGEEALQDLRESIDMAERLAARVTHDLNKAILYNKASRAALWVADHIKTKKLKITIDERLRRKENEDAYDRALHLAQTSIKLFANKSDNLYPKAKGILVEAYINAASVCITYIEKVSWFVRGTYKRCAHLYASKLLELGVAEAGDYAAHRIAGQAYQGSLGPFASRFLLEKGDTNDIILRDHDDTITDKIHQFVIHLTLQDNEKYLTLQDNEKYLALQDNEERSRNRIHRPVCVDRALARDHLKIAFDYTLHKKLKISRNGLNNLYYAHNLMSDGYRRMQKPSSNKKNRAEACRIMTTFVAAKASELHPDRVPETLEEQKRGRRWIAQNCSTESDTRAAGRADGRTDRGEN